MLATRKTSSSGPSADQRSNADCEVADLRGMADVPEVDDRGDPAVVVEQDVVEIQVAVHDVRPKPCPARRDVRLVAIEHGLDETAPAEIFDRFAERPEFRRV